MQIELEDLRQRIKTGVGSAVVLASPLSSVGPEHSANPAVSSRNPSRVRERVFAFTWTDAPEALTLIAKRFADESANIIAVAQAWVSQAEFRLECTALVADDQHEVLDAYFIRHSGEQWTYPATGVPQKFWWSAAGCVGM